jgi:hypothetical protein
MGIQLGVFRRNWVPTEAHPKEEEEQEAEDGEGSDAREHAEKIRPPEIAGLYRTDERYESSGNTDEGHFRVWAYAIVTLYLYLDV